MSIHSQTTNGRSDSRNESAALTSFGRIELLDESGRSVESWLVNAQQCTIGSGPACFVRISNGGLAPVHANIVFGRRNTLIKSSHGDFRVGRKQVSEWLIDEPATISLGKLRFVVYPTSYVRASRDFQPTVGSLQDASSRLNGNAKVPSTDVDAALASQSVLTEQAKEELRKSILQETLAAVAVSVTPLQNSLEALSQNWREFMDKSERESDKDRTQEQMQALEAKLPEINAALESLDQRVSNVTDRYDNAIHSLADEIRSQFRNIDDRISELPQPKNEAIELTLLSLHEQIAVVQEQLSQQLNRGLESVVNPAPHVEQATAEVLLEVEEEKPHAFSCDDAPVATSPSHAWETYDIVDASELRYNQFDEAASGVFEEVELEATDAHAELPQYPSHFDGYGETVEHSEAAEYQGNSDGLRESIELAYSDVESIESEPSVEVHNYASDVDEADSELVGGTDAYSDDSDFSNEYSAQSFQDEPANDDYSRYENETAYHSTADQEASPAAEEGYHSDEEQYDSNGSFDIASYAALEMREELEADDQSYSEPVQEYYEHLNEASRTSESLYASEEIDSYVNAEFPSSTDSVPVDDSEFIRDLVNNPTGTDEWDDSAEHGEEKPAAKLPSWFTEQDDQEIVAPVEDALVPAVEPYVESEDYSEPVSHFADRFEVPFDEEPLEIESTSAEHSQQSYDESSDEESSYDDSVYDDADPDSTLDEFEDEEIAPTYTRNSERLNQSKTPVTYDRLTSDADEVDIDADPMISDDFEQEEESETEYAESVHAELPRQAEPEQVEEEEESVEEYMQRLLQRVKGDSAIVSAPSTKIAPQSNTVSYDKAKTEQINSDLDETEEVESLDIHNYTPRSAAPENNLNLAAMRALANETARTAIARSNTHRPVSPPNNMSRMITSIVGFVIGTSILLFNGLTLNVAFLGMVASYMIFLIWGYEATQGAGLLGVTAVKSNTTAPNRASSDE